MYEFLMVFVFLAIYFVIMIKWNKRSNCDRISIKDKNKLDINAHITDIKRHTVGSPMGARWRTIVSFSDGFTFITHVTEYKDILTGYLYYISKNVEKQIVLAALTAHKVAIQQNNGVDVKVPNTIFDSEYYALYLQEQKREENFLVYIYSPKDRELIQKAQTIDTNKYPVEKFSHDGCYYGFNMYKNGEDQVVYCSYNEWCEKMFWIEQNIKKIDRKNRIKAILINIVFLILVIGALMFMMYAKKYIQS